MRAMKDSGIEWIGEIPQDWDRTKLLNVLRVPISDGPHETPSLVNSGIPFISVDSVGNSENVDLSVCKKFISEEDYINYSKKTKIELGDILFTKAATIGKTAIVRDEIFMVWSPIAIIKTDNEIVHNKYIYYVLSCSEFINHVSLLGSCNTQINVGMRELERAMIPLPSKDKQKSIAAYLGSKCSQIDSIIEKQQVVIEKLKEYKLSIITEAVTKGLDPNVEMKDSGIEWIGKIPAHWEVLKVARIANVVRGSSPRPAGDPKYFNGNDFPWITVAEVTKGDGKYVYKTDTYLTNEGAMQSRIVEADTLLLSNSGATLGVPKVTLIRGCINDGSVAFYDLKIDKMFLLYVFKSLTLELRKQMAGYGQPNLNTDIIKSIFIPKATIDEQEKIVSYLDEKCIDIDLTITKKSLIVDKLIEYKKSLIYEVVTGKKEV